MNEFGGYEIEKRGQVNVVQFKTEISVKRKLKKYDFARKDMLQELDVY